jgi:succinate dehydrogenase hydrophobic anchor subunit
MAISKAWSDPLVSKYRGVGLLGKKGPVSFAITWLEFENSTQWIKHKVYSGGKWGVHNFLLQKTSLLLLAICHTFLAFFSHFYKNTIIVATNPPTTNVIWNPDFCVTVARERWSIILIQNTLPVGLPKTSTSWSDYLKNTTVGKARAIVYYSATIAGLSWTRVCHMDFVD